MAESSLKNECCQDILERMQTEENNSDPAPMVVKNAAAADSLRVIPDINKMKKKKKKRKPTIEISPVRARLLDYWNMRRVGKHAKAASSEIPGSDERKDLRANTEKHIDPWLLRETNPDWVPVAVEKDARSDIAEIDVKKYLVPKDALLGDFIAYVRMWIFLKKKKPIFVFFKNTEPPTGASMGAIDEENTDEDGFLHMTYSGNDTFSYSGNDVTC
ncbi:unnamed protein product [Prunus armeniaca]|uniref:Autophagy-related protein n=1 Tax=Prunus armeniaca TaxID=36596 RepID=A0A6J5WWT7_PRUAR|nr:unnamed protein product [Prunus armeniaca]